MPARTLSVVTDAKTFTVHEMTIAQVRSWWEGIPYPGYPGDIADHFAIPGISLTDLAMLCHCDVSDFDEIPYSQVEAINAAARELNPLLFRLQGMIADASEQIVATLSELCREVVTQDTTKGEPQ